MTQTVSTEVRDFLTGRIWLREHTPFSPLLIHEHIERGDIHCIRGITTKKSVLQQQHLCNRCENDKPSRFTTFNCAKCEGLCSYCRHCLKMGRVSSCTELVYWVGEQPIFSKKHALAWKGTLTPRQQKASDELAESTEQGLPHLVYAV